MSDGTDSDATGGSDRSSGIAGVLPGFLTENLTVKLVVMLLVGVLISGAVVAFLFADIDSSLDNQVESQVHSDTSIQSVVYQGWLTDRWNALEAMATSDEIQEGNETLNNWLFQQRQNMVEDVQNLHVVHAPSGVITGSSSVDHVGANVYESGLRQDLGDGQNFVSHGSVELPASDNEVFVIGVKSPLGERLIIATVPVNTTVVQSQAFEGAETTLRSTEGERLLGATQRENIDIPEQLSNDGDILITRTGDRIVGMRVLAHDRNTNLPLARHTPGVTVGTVVVTSVPTDEAFAVQRQVTQTVALALAVTFLLLTGTAAVMMRSVTGDVNDLSRRAKQIRDGDFDVDVRSDRLDEVGDLYRSVGAMRDSLQDRIQEAERARKEAEVSRAEAMEMNDYLEEKAAEYSEIMQACARGDLTRRMDGDGQNDAMDQIAEEFNEMISELELTTGQLKTFAAQVEESGRGVQESAETVRGASEQVADSIQRISDDTYDQRERLQSIAEEMDAIADQLEGVAAENPDVEFAESLETISETVELIEETAHLSEETMEESETVAGAAEEQAAELDEVSSRAEELVRYAEYLGDGLNNFETEEEHEFVFQTGSTPSQFESDAEGSEAGADPDADAEEGGDEGVTD